MAGFFTPPRPAEFSEVRKHFYAATVPEDVLREGVLMKINTSNGGVEPVYTVAGTRPTSSLLSSVATLYGVMVGSHDETEDPVMSSRVDYAGQTPTKRVSVADCVPHRELILQPIDSNGEKTPSAAVPSNIGKPVAIKYQNFSFTVGSNTYWVYAGAELTTPASADGYIVGITGDKNLIVRISRSKWITL